MKKETNHNNEVRERFEREYPDLMHLPEGGMSVWLEESYMNGMVDWWLSEISQEYARGRGDEAVAREKEDIKIFGQARVDALREVLATMPEEKPQLDKNDPDNYGACYAIAGFNDAILKFKERISALLPTDDKQIKE